MTPDELLAQFHRQVRLAAKDAGPHDITERVGLVRRTYPDDPAKNGAMVECPEGLGDTEAGIEAAIDAEVAFFTERGQPFEWKTYADDKPRDLVDRLSRKGFRVGEVEVVMLGEVRDLVSGAHLAEGVRVREFSGHDDWERVRILMDGIWSAEMSWVADALRSEQQQAPDLFRPFLAEETGGERRVVSYAAVRLTPGVDFAGLWGGSTHPDWRGRGLYRGLTAYRARLALEAGHPYVRVDTSPDSRPILRRLGLHQVTTTTPCLFDPSTGPDLAL